MPSLWGEPFKRLIDHPKILPYLIELLGPYVRLDHDYALFMNKGDRRGGLHGGEDGGRPGGPEGDHWYRYRDGVMRNGLCVMTYNLTDAPDGAGGFACIPGSHKSNFPDALCRRRFGGSSVRRIMSSNRRLKRVTSCSSPKPSFTEPCRGRRNTSAAPYFTNTAPGIRRGREATTTSANTASLTEQQKRMLLPPSIGTRPRVVEDQTSE